MLENGLIHNGYVVALNIDREILMQNMLITEQFGGNATSLNDKYIERVFSNVKSHY